MAACGHGDSRKDPFGDANRGAYANVYNLAGGGLLVLHLVYLLPYCRRISVGAGPWDYSCNSGCKISVSGNAAVALDGDNQIGSCGFLCGDLPDMALCQKSFCVHFISDRPAHCLPEYAGGNPGGK